MNDGTSLPRLLTAIPGPASRAAVDVLAAHECPAITARRSRRAEQLGASDDDPFVWGEAVGTNVQDLDGNVFVDMTAGFAVATQGHRPPHVVAAVRAQLDLLLHAMGDAWPDATRARLLAALARIAPAGDDGPLDVALLGLSGADAVDAAVKTARLHTGRRGVLAFAGGYHGLSLGTVGLQGYKKAFTQPFADIVHPDVRWLPFGADTTSIQRALADGDVGLVLVEPIQGRGGVHPAPDGWLATLRQASRAAGALLAYDEIQCGLGRTGTVWAHDHDAVVPDLLCVGKSLGGGFPMSACLGTRPVMNAWGASTGEALHTQTFLGHPVGAAAACAVLDHLPTWTARCAERGADLAHALQAAGWSTRGRGLMRAVPVGPHAFATCRALQRRGYIVLPAGPAGDALCLTPPATLTDAQISGFVLALSAAEAEVRP
jgi:4-aminobutyrate aminotransferase/(S)-3-amino-2-methylpropionate transaminase